MSSHRTRYGSVIAALGSVLLSLSVFMPWYALHWTIHPAASERALEGTTEVHNGYAYNYFPLPEMLLAVAWCSFVLSLLRLASRRPTPPQRRDPIALLGLLAALCVLFLMADPAASHVKSEPFASVAVSLRGGIWLALGSAAAIILGALWPRGVSQPSTNDRAPEIHAELSGGTSEVNASLPRVGPQRGHQPLWPRHNKAATTGGRAAAMPATKLLAALLALGGAVLVFVLLVWWSSAGGSWAGLLGVVAALCAVVIDLRRSRGDRPRSFLASTSIFVLLLWPPVIALGVLLLIAMGTGSS